jgi:hypothetical protein
VGALLDSNYYSQATGQRNENHMCEQPGQEQNMGHDKNS